MWLESYRWKKNIDWNVIGKVSASPFTWVTFQPRFVDKHLFLKHTHTYTHTHTHAPFSLSPLSNQLFDFAAKKLDEVNIKLLICENFFLSKTFLWFFGWFVRLIKLLCWPSPGLNIINTFWHLNSPNWHLKCLNRHLGCQFLLYRTWRLLAFRMPRFSHLKCYWWLRRIFLLDFHPTPSPTFLSTS